MSKYNTAVKPSVTQNLAGGKAYKLTAELELASILLTSFAEDQYYRSNDETVNRLRTLLSKCDAEFAAKAIVFARTKYGMRSITHIAASELAKYAKGHEWAKNFYERVIYRPDDMLEIIAYHKAHSNAMLTHAMRKGFEQAFSKFDAYSLAKYRGEGKDVKLVDVVNLVHPKGNTKNKKALKELINGALVSEDTWEAMLTEAGQKAKTEKEKAKLKEKAWTKLIKEKKIKQFALLRNLRNIMEQAPKVLAAALAQLTDEDRIRKSLILPFRYVSALREVEKLDCDGVRETIQALNKAVDLSIDTVPQFKGRTLVAIDVSSSMDGMLSRKGTMSMRTAATLFGAIMAKRSDADIMIFGTYAKYVQFNPDDSTLTITSNIDHLNRGYGEREGTYNVGHGTNFNAIFEQAVKKYDRVAIFTEGQGWIGGGAPDGSFAAYRKKYDCNPFIYNFDLAGYGTVQFPKEKVYFLAGFSDKVFNLLQYFEKDKQALITEILKTEL